MQTTNNRKHTTRERETEKKLNLIINLIQYHVSYYLLQVNKPSYLVWKGYMTIESKKKKK